MYSYMNTSKLYLLLLQHLHLQGPPPFLHAATIVGIEIHVLMKMKMKMKNNLPMIEAIK